MLSVVNQRMENFDARAKAETEAALSQIAVQMSSSAYPNGNGIVNGVKSLYIENKIVEVSSSQPSAPIDRERYVAAGAPSCVLCTFSRLFKHSTWHHKVGQTGGRVTVDLL